MKHPLLLLLLAVSASLFGQVRLHQIEAIPAGHIVYRVGNVTSTVVLTEDLITVTPPSGYSSTDQAALNDEFAADISALQAGGADGNNFTSDITFSGTTTKTLTLERDGLADLTASFTDNVVDGDASSTNEIQTLSRNGANVTLSNGGLTVSIDDADANPNNELQTISKSGSTVTLSNGGGTFTDAVNDADASATNEINVVSRAANSNTISFTNGGGSTNVVTAYHAAKVTVSGGATEVSLPASVTNLDDATFTRNGIVYKASTTDGNEYFFLSGSGANTKLRPSTGQAPLADSEVITYKYPR